MKSRCDRAWRDAQHPGDVRRRQADVVREDEHRTVLDGEVKEGPLELVAVGELGEVVVSFGPIDGQARQLDRAPAGPPDVVVACVDEEPVEPGIECLRIAETPDVAPGSKERVLHGIFRGIPVAEDPPRDRVQAVVCGGREGIEGLVVAPLCAFDEFGRQRRSPQIGATFCRTHPVMTPPRPGSFIRALAPLGDEPQGMLAGDRQPGVPTY
jgi:hypothetical protein